MMNGGYRFLFGPVRSRRLGRSLGIDLVPLKVCTYDCPYCQVGVTTLKTLERRDYVPVAEVLAEFDDWLARDGQADCVTLAGGGEPTLHLRFGEVIEAIGARCSLRRILLSNGSLFSDPEVRGSAARADVVKATLSAWDQVSFEQMHHPHPDLTFDAFLEGLKIFRTDFHGEYWLEVFVVSGLNDDPERIGRIAELARRIQPDRIHLNTAVRPARDSSVLPVSSARMDELARLFSPVAEVIGVATAGAPIPKGAMNQLERSGTILALLQRHPCTAVDISKTLGLSVAEVEQAIDSLSNLGRVRREPVGSGDFFVAT
ncbi:MAG: radical SAM protein [bacterium]